MSAAGTSVRTLAQWLARRAAASPDAPAITFGSVTWSYAEFSARVARTAGWLTARGITGGARVGILANNHPDALVLLFAATAVGAIYVPLNVRLTADELLFIATDAELGLVVADEANRDKLAALEPSVPRVALDGAAPGWPGFSDEIAAAKLGEPYSQPEDGIAAIVYTSGTTGRPKGAMLSHANLWANDLNWLFATRICAADVALITAPLFHVGGLFVLTTTTLLMGGHVVLMPGFDARAVLDAIERHGVTTTFGVPAMMLFLSQHPRFEDADLRTMRLYVAGGAPVPEPLLRQYAQRGVPVSQCYGMSEVVSATTFLDPAEAITRLGSAGRAGMLAEVRVVDADRQPVAAGATGEICVRGANVSPGYWRNPVATARTIDADGWLYTGDAGVIDADGYLTMRDRVKDMIISGGENIYPAEIERHLFEHPAIANVAVIGLPDERWGERVAAVAVLHDDNSLEFDALVAFCAPRLARYKIPKSLHLMRELPLNGSGKVVKATLRALLTEEAV